MPSPPASPRHAPRADWWWIFDPRLSLRARFALIFGGSIVLFTILIAWMAGRLLHRQLEAQLGPGFETLALQVSDKIDRTIYERYRQLNFTANLPVFRDRSLAPPERRRLLETLRHHARDFAWVGFVDPNGRVVSATNGVFEDEPFAERPWVRGARDRPYAGSLHDTPPLGDRTSDPDAEPGRVLDLAVPVQDSNGVFMGVLGAHVRWDWAREVQLSVIPETARRELLGVTVYASRNDVLLDSGGSGWTAPPDVPEPPPTQRLRGSMIEAAAGGTTYLTGYVRSRGYRDYRGLGWLTTVRQPVERAFAPVRQLRVTIARWGFIFAVAMIAVSWAVGAQLTRRMRSVALAADEIRSGNVLAVLPQPRGEGEVDRMCEALGDLVEDLRAKQKKEPAAETPASDPPPAPGRYVKPTGSDPRRVIW